MSDLPDYSYRKVACGYVEIPSFHYVERQLHLFLQGKFTEGIHLVVVRELVVLVSVRYSLQGCNICRRTLSFPEASEQTLMSTS